MTEPTQATSLDDLSDVVVDVPVTRPDGKTVIVAMRALSEAAVFARRRQIAWPKPPLTDFKKVDGEVKPLANYLDEGYQRQLADANRQLTYLLLLDSLTLDVPGANEDDRVAALQSRLGQFAFIQLVEASNSLNVVGEAQIAEMVRSFRPDRSARPPLDAALETAAQPVAAPAGG